MTLKGNGCRVTLIPMWNQCMPQRTRQRARRKYRESSATFSKWRHRLKTSRNFRAPIYERKGTEGTPNTLSRRPGKEKHNQATLKRSCNRLTPPPLKDSVMIMSKRNYRVIDDVCITPTSTMRVCSVLDTESGTNFVRHRDLTSSDVHITSGLNSSVIDSNGRFKIRTLQFLWMESLKCGLTFR